MQHLERLGAWIHASVGYGKTNSSDVSTQHCPHYPLCHEVFHTRPTSRVQALQLLVLARRGARTDVEGVNHVRHVHPRVVKGVALRARHEVHGARYLLHHHKASQVAARRLRTGCHDGTCGQSDEVGTYEHVACGARGTAQECRKVMPRMRKPCVISPRKYQQKRSSDRRPVPLLPPDAVYASCVPRTHTPWVPLTGRRACGAADPPKAPDCPRTPPAHPSCGRLEQQGKQCAVSGLPAFHVPGSNACQHRA